MTTFLLIVAMSATHALTAIVFFFVGGHVGILAERESAPKRGESWINRLAKASDEARRASKHN